MKGGGRSWNGKALSYGPGGRREVSKSATREIGGRR